MVLPDEPEALELPADPSAPFLVEAWQKVVQPASIGLTGLSIAFTAVAAVIARRNHMREMSDLERSPAASSEIPLDTTSSDEDQ
jgi:hypothetical protein